MQSLVGDINHKYLVMKRCAYRRVAQAVATKPPRGLWVWGGDASPLVNGTTQKDFFTFAARQHSKGMPITTALLEDEGLSKGDAASAAAFGTVVKTAAGTGMPPPHSYTATPTPGVVTTSHAFIYSNYFTSCDNCIR